MPDFVGEGDERFYGESGSDVEAFISLFLSGPEVAAYDLNSFISVSETC